VRRATNAAASVLALARRNVEDSSYSDRIKIKNLDVTALTKDPRWCH
jgi:tRNA1(Val) A37 N6-methylase TrmN6